MTNIKTFSVLFFCSLFFQNDISASDRPSPFDKKFLTLTSANSNSTTPAVSENSNLEMSIFDLEDEFGNIDKTPINRFAIYDACRRSPFIGSSSELIFQKNAKTSLPNHFNNDETSK